MSQTTFGSVSGLAVKPSNVSNPSGTNCESTVGERHSLSHGKRNSSSARERRRDQEDTCTYKGKQGKDNALDAVPFVSALHKLEIRLLSHTT